MPLISVIVPVYKAEKYLAECLDSILAQTFSDFEVILVDDGSPDKSGEICDVYAEKDPRVQVIHQRNQGQAAARNRAIKQSKAKWIHFVDSDDVIHLQMLEVLYNAVMQNCVRLATCGMLKAGEMPQKFQNEVHATSNVYTCNEELFLDYLNTNNSRYGVVCAKLIDKAIVQKYPFNKGRIFEDSAVVCNWFCEAGQLADVDLPLYYYRINPESTTHRQFSVKHFDLLWSYEQQIACYRKRNYSVLLKRLCNEYIWIAHDYYLKATNEMNARRAAGIIARNSVRVYRANKESFTITQKQYLYILETFYPRRMAFYWRWKTSLKYIKKLIYR